MRKPATCIALTAVSLMLGLTASAATAYAGPPQSLASDTAQCSLPTGTAGTPDVAVPGSLGFNQLRPAPATATLPATVVYRDTRTTFNRLWSFALDGGRVYAKPTSQSGGWRAVALPGCLDGRVTGISADDDELFAVDLTGSVYTMDQALNSPMLWNWTNRWGSPLWADLNGLSLPPRTISWSASVISPAEDVTWTDGAGNAQQVGGGKVTNVFALTGDGSRITFLDPWLPADHSYEVQTPIGGRFRSMSMAAAASTIFVVNKFGDMYTRLYDFDMSGADTVFFRSSYDDQRGRTPAPYWGLQRLGIQYAAFQLPANGWLHQPKVAGEITGHISIHKTGHGSNARELRVEGRKGGHTGFWHKNVEATQWRFTPTNARLSTSLIANSTRDRSKDTLAPSTGLTFAGRKTGYQARITSFSSATEKSPLTLTFPDGAKLRLILHTVDALRQSPRGPGLDGTARVYNGAIEVPRSVLASLEDQPAAVRSFVSGDLKSKRFTETSVSVTTHEFTITALKLGLTR